MDVSRSPALSDVPPSPSSHARASEPAGIAVELQVALDRLRGLRPFVDDLYDACWNVLFDARDSATHREVLERHDERALRAYAAISHAAWLLERSLQDSLAQLTSGDR